MCGAGGPLRDSRRGPEQRLRQGALGGCLWEAPRLPALASFQAPLLPACQRRLLPAEAPSKQASCILRPSQWHVTWSRRAADRRRATSAPSCGVTACRCVRIAGQLCARIACCAPVAAYSAHALCALAGWRAHAPCGRAPRSLSSPLQTLALRPATPTTPETPALRSPLIRSGCQRCARHPPQSLNTAINEL